MKDSSKTKQEIIAGKSVLKQGNPDFEKLESKYNRTEKELWNSEELFRGYLEYVPDGVYINDLEGKFLYGNRKSKEIIGYLRDELIGKNFMELNILTEDSLRKAARLLRDNIGGKSTSPEELELIDKEGRIIPVEITTNVIQRMGQRVVLGFVRDITERKRDEEALQKSEENFRRSLEDSPLGICIVTAGGEIIYANQAILDIYDYDSVEELRRTPIKNRYTPQSYAEFKTRREKIKAGGNGPTEYEISIVRKNGALRHLQVFRNDVLWNGERQYQAIFQDITDRKRAEEELRESEEKYRSLFDNSIDAILLTAPDGRILAANPEACRIFGRTEEEICRIGKEGLIDLTDQHLSAKLVKRVRTGQFRGELTYVRKNGTLFPGEMSSAIFRDRDGNSKTSMFIRDITKRKMAEKKLQDTLGSLRKAFGTTIQVMVSAVEARDPYTSGHQSRSADLARAIATEMGLPQAKVDGIRMAGSIHDIGKLSIPSEILTKPSKLMEIEFTLIKEHSRIGYAILKNVESPWPLAEIVYQHHERMNGSGYPRNLKGDDIIMEARILAVADVVESMASYRPYRPALGINPALDEIEKNKGTLYDADVVDACMRLFQEKGFKLVGT